MRQSKMQSSDTYRLNKCSQSDKLVFDYLKNERQASKIVKQINFEAVCVECFATICASNFFFSSSLSPLLRLIYFIFPSLLSSFFRNFCSFYSLKYTQSLSHKDYLLSLSSFPVCSVISLSSTHSQRDSLTKTIFFLFYLFSFSLLSLSHTATPP